MGDKPVEHIALGEGLVDMRRVDIARQDRKQLDIFERQRMGKARRVARLQLVKGPVLDAFHARLLPSRGSCRGAARRPPRSSELAAS
jgi:hypothetical protein